MRKGDLEMLEVRLEPLQIARDRIEDGLGAAVRQINELRDQVRELQRNEQSHGLEIAQGLASIRSLLQRANRAAREQGIIEDDQLVAEEVPEVNTPRTADQILADTRAANPQRTVL